MTHTKVEEVMAKFSAELQALLSFQQEGEYIVIKPRQFLSSENFAEISRILRDIGGEYISAGKDSHFRIPTGEPATQTSGDKTQAKAPESLHFKVSKVTVVLAKTMQKGEKEWTKQSYGLEVEVGSDTVDIVQRARIEAEQLVESWLSEPMMPAAEIPQIDIAELDALDWTRYKKPQQKATPEEPAWIKNPVEFTSWKNPPQALLQLVKALKRAPNEKLVLGNWEYGFSGENKFVSRNKKKNGS